MKLVPDAVRDILLYLESNLTYSENAIEYQRYLAPISWEKIVTSLHSPNKYSDDEIRYAIQELNEANMIECRIKMGTYNNWISCDIHNITWSGHEFLNNVRPQTVWKATKEKATKLGGMSLKGISFLASTIIQAIATNPELISSIVQNINM